MTLRHAYRRFRQFGGWRLLVQYAKMGVLGTVVKALLSGRGIKDAYGVVRQCIDQKLMERYGTQMEKFINKAIPSDAVSSKRSQTVFTCWWQGEDVAPQLVKACWASQRKYLPDGWRHVIITQKNCKDYITLPEYIVAKMERGRIPQALFSDLVRLELLIKYGGVWMDASVLCTEPNYPKRLLTCSLFLFQYHDSQRRFCGFSNWLISAECGNKVLEIVRDLLHQYWRDYDCTVEYYVFHLFINEIVRRCPELLKQMPWGNAWTVIQLGARLAAPFDNAWWSDLTARCCFHKLNYRKETVASHSYCNYITTTYLFSEKWKYSDDTIKNT